MSLLVSLDTGASGLEAASTDLSVIGDNIANANTIGFKQSRAEFETALSESLIGGYGQVGLGVNVQSTRLINTQGSLSTTGVPTDLALEGQGFFMVNGSHDGVNGNYYTRNGAFQIDKSGYLTNDEGLRVQGYTSAVDGTVGGALGDLKLGTAAALPRTTTTITMKGNLQADAAVPATWDPANPDTTSNFSSSQTIYDSLGAAHQVQTYFRKSGEGTWEFHSMTDGGGVQGGTAGTPSEVASGTLTFDSNGKLTAQTQGGTFNPIGATQPQALTLNFGDPTSVTGGTGLAGMTQFAAASATSFVGQDGAASGDLTGISVQQDGSVVGSFSNGENRTLGQVAVAQFQASDDLARVGGNIYQQTPQSGEPSIGSAGTGGRGSITAGALEQSNVDLAGEFVHMISAQREFQANSKTVQTADSLLQEILQLKR